MAANRAVLTSHAPAGVRIGAPSARAEASAQARSRPACSSRHAARQTRASTRRSRRAVSIRAESARNYLSRESCPGHAG
ncbi:MAG TPA: hypothetical protein VNO54_02055, partial [Streptosporangiaceae bacterium]|nr:hypothetical protein [Streptosporangiaceae bacterium]